MAEWELTVGDESRYYLVATLEERHIAAGGDTRAPSLSLPFGWEEILDDGTRRRAPACVLAVSLDLHIDQAPNRYWLYLTHPIQR